MLNKVILMGRLVADPEFRQTTSGVPVCRFTVAIDRPVRKDQERQTDFIDVTAWRTNAEFVSRYFSKGKMIIVEGSLHKDAYTANDGSKRYSTYVQADRCTFGETKAASQGAGDYASGYNQQGSYGQQGGYQQNAPQQGGWQQPAPQQHPAPQAPAQDSLNIGDIGEFEEILSDGEVPF